MYEYEKLVEKLRRKIADCLEKGKDKLPTQEELCREYRVSRVTVRRALQLLEEEGYLKSRQGSGSILTGLSPDKGRNEIALLLSDPEAYIMPALTSSIRNAASESGFSLSIYRTGADFQKEREILEELLNKTQIPGGLIAENWYQVSSPNGDLYRRLSEKGCRIVFLFGKDPAFFFAGCVRTGAGQAAEDAVSRLTAAGHRDLAGLFQMSTHTEIEAGSSFLHSLRTNGLPLSKSRLSFLSDIDVDEIIRNGTSPLLEQFLQQIGFTCTALLCETDLLAYAASAVLTSHGVNIPQGLSIMSIHSSYLRNRSALHIDSYEPIENPGSAAVHLLIREITGGSPETITIGLQYLPGNSISHKR